MKPRALLLLVIIIDLFSVPLIAAGFSNTRDALFESAPVGNPPTVYKMDFESVDDFSLTFNDWTVADQDGHETYGLQDHTFPHQMEAMAFLCFNPASVVPSMASDPAIQPHGGQRFGACFSSNPPSNSDWFISPKISMGTGGSFSFWIKSYNSTFGLDEYTVAVSTTDNNPASFTVISGTGTLQTTTEWVKKTFSLSQYDNRQIYVAIHCVSNDHFLMMIDDLEVRADGTSAGLQADFTAGQTSVMVGESVDFTDLSEGSPTSWSWTFTGAVPSHSTLQNPPGINYLEAGAFAVTLKISNGNSSDSITKTNYITVTDYPSNMSLDFESLEDFTLTFNPWTTVDVKGGLTYGIVNVSFPHDYDPMAFICFNPFSTQPAMNDQMSAHGGQKLGCCFSTKPPYPQPNNKWLISPKMKLGLNPKIEFWAKSYNIGYGFEKFRVAVSTGSTNPLDFTPLDTIVSSAPENWALMSYNLSAYTGQAVYIGIQCITNDGFILMIDDISITSTVGIGGVEPGMDLAAFPNPAHDFVILSTTPLQASISIDLINSLGQTERSWNESLISGRIRLNLDGLSGGIYILRVTGKESRINRRISIVKH